MRRFKHDSPNIPPPRTSPTRQPLERPDCGVSIGRTIVARGGSNLETNAREGVLVKLTLLLDMLATIERRHPDQFIEVEVRDEAGFLTVDFDVTTEFVIPAKRITVRFVPKAGAK